MKEKVMLENIYKINKLIIILLIAILVVLTMGVSKLYVNNNSNETNETQESEYNTDYDVSMFTEIEAKDIKAKTKKEKQVVYIGRESCGWCAAFLPNLWEAQDEYNFTTLYIDLAKIIDFNSSEFKLLDEDAYNTLNSLTGEGYENYMSENLGATPMILVIENNKIISAQTGYSEYESFVTVLTDAGIK